MQTMDKQHFTLRKLGEAIYKHKKLASIAKDAEKSVNYLAAKGVLK